MDLPLLVLADYNQEEQMDPEHQHLLMDHNQEEQTDREEHMI